MKKYIYRSTLGLVFAMAVSSCNKNLESINNDPNHITSSSMDYNLLFTAVQAHTAGTDYEAWRNSMIYCSTMIQHLSSLQGYWNGDKYTYSGGYNSAYWDRQFPNAVTNVVETLNNWKGKTTYANAYNITRIMKVVVFQRMTDLYGDVPYSEAGKGYSGGVTYPKYDKQQAIYMDMLNELNEAAKALDANATNTLKNADVMYQGDVTKWKKFAYSQMLRLAMRMTKVDPATAQTWVQTAVAGGLFTSNDDNGIIKHDAVTSTNSNGNGLTLVYNDPNASRVSQSFIDRMKNTNDPRLIYYATVCTNPGIAVGSSGYDYGDTTWAKQLGMPNGYDQQGATTATDLHYAANYPGNKTDFTSYAINSYSVVNRYTFARLDAPSFILTYAENQLLLAEAALRGWVSGNAADYYNAGVTAAMNQLTQTGAGAGVSAAQIAAYLAANPFNAADGYNQINTQYYIATFMDEYEAWSNWRRSGYPVLQQVVYIGNVTNGTIPRRFTYPTSEATINATNYNDAISRYTDGDKMTSRMWWDAAQ
ncbi:SusD/RagB family nutrient-binding outer membrane lipoprotein [Chitinophaga sancti]|uniref:SusD/RagB family nutrient-binding outer membrane lipoprotein n=1 Tax=Chitinophaga sancti TaxID=1004 RepID=UPI003F7A8849